MITPIDKLRPIAALDGDKPAAREITAGGQNPFQAVFQSAIDNVRQTDAAKVEAQYLMATGQLDNPAELTIAATKSQIAVDLLVQLRNKALDAYNELTRINM